MNKKMCSQQNIIDYIELYQYPIDCSFLTVYNNTVASCQHVWHCIATVSVSLLTEPVKNTLHPNQENAVKLGA